jgi:hypothetical protein
MVQTRRQYNRWVEQRERNYQTSQSQQSSESEESQHSFYNPTPQSEFSWSQASYEPSPQGECDECSQRSESNGGNYNPSHDTHGGSYRNNDTCKRHRTRDNEPYTETVTTYRRRKAHR